MAKTKNPAAVALGRLGGKVKGVAKGFGALTDDEKKKMGRDGALARWGTKKATKKATKVSVRKPGQQGTE